MSVRRLHQSVLIAATLLGSWLGMQAVHEFGHVLGAWATGGKVAKVVLHPLTISRTELAENPWPLTVVWSGPMLGVLLPLVGWVLARQGRCPGVYLLRFFAGFCLVANGAYIGAGVVDPVGDAAEMLHYGSPAWLLGGFGLITVPLGLGLWHGQGPHFGFGAAQGHVSRRAAYGTAAGVVGLACVELMFANTRPLP